MTPFHQLLSELGERTDRVDAASIAAACELIAGAGRIAGHAGGRERMQIAAFILRLHQIGLRSAMQGETTMPRLGRGDLMICAAATGYQPTVGTLMAGAREAGADILFITGRADAPLADLASQVLVIPEAVRGEATGAEGDRRLPLPEGTLFEGVLFLLFEVMLLDLRARLGVPLDLIEARRSNLE